jgi:hypothetical protein
MEVVLLACLLRRRIFRTLPIFTLYIGWCLCIDITTGIVLSIWPERYLWFYLIEFTIDALYQFRILLELARSVRHHNRGSSPRVIILTLLIPMAAALIWQMAAWSAPMYSTFTGKLLVHLLQSVAILRAGFVLALVWWSSLQGLHWPDRELRIVTGFGFYSFVALSVSILHTHQTLGPMYHFLDQAVSASYAFTLLYWIYAFAPKKSETRPLLFTNASSVDGRGRNR